MEIRVVEEKGRAQIEVTILSGPDDPRVSGIVRQLQMVDGKMTGYVPGTINRRVVLLADVSWIQTDGNVTLIKLVNGETLESSNRLTELEDALKDTAFVRTSRQELVNLDQVTGIKPAGSGRMLLSLGEKTLVASRKYAAEIKRRIGIV
jgi:response regulator receiver protein